MTNETTKGETEKGQSGQPEQEADGEEPVTQTKPKARSRRKKETAEAPASADSGDTGAVVPAPRSTNTVAAKGSVNVEVPEHALQKAIVQLQNLTALREQEAERQERAIANMEAAMNKQGTVNRWLLTVSVLLFLGGVAVMVIMMNLRSVNEKVSANVQDLSGAVTATGEVVQESAKQHSRDLASVSEEVKAANLEQAQRAAKIESGVNQTKESVTREVSKQTAAIVQVGDKMTKTRQAMQQEAVATQKAVANEVGKQAKAISSVHQAVAAAQTEQREGLAEQREGLAEQREGLAEQREGLAVQREGLAEIKKEVSQSRDLQTSELEKVRTEVVEARVESANLSKSVDAKIERTGASLAGKVDESIAALKAERDRVQAEVKKLLEERMELLTEREIELHGVEEKLRIEEEVVGKMAAEAREETRNIVTDALKKLAEINGAPPIIVGTESAQPESPPPSAEENTAVDATDAVTEAMPVPEADAESTPAAEPAPTEAAQPMVEPAAVEATPEAAVNTDASGG